nr:hypothetical protein [Tanacetum cinerariifolium]
MKLQYRGQNGGLGDGSNDWRRDLSREIDDTLKRLNAEEVHREKSKSILSKYTERSYEPSDDEPQHAIIRGEPPRPYKHSPPKKTISTETIAYLTSREPFDEPQHATMGGERPQSYKQLLPKDTIRTGTSMSMSTSTGSIIEAEPAKAENSSSGY